MSFSFRRRADQWTSPHERAQYRAAERLDGPIEPTEEAWLEDHLADCRTCRAVADDYEAQHLDLSAFRADAPEPPRDLWARTSAAIEREASRSGASRGSTRRSRRPSSMPLGAISGLLVVVVVVSAAFLSQRPAPSITPPGTQIARESSPASFVLPKATPIKVATSVEFFTLGVDGPKLHQSKVEAVCSEKDESDCAPIPESSPVAVNLPNEPESVIRSPTKKEIVVISGSTSSGGGSVVLVPTPAETTPASQPPTSASASPTSSASPTAMPPSEPVVVLPDVVIDPTAAYSPDGSWFAFSARPADRSHGSDIYVVRAGETRSVALTSDHRSVFASWLGNVVVGSRSVPAETPAAGASEPPAAVDGETLALDPSTGASATVARRGLWRPAIDPTHRRAVYWDGTITLDANGTNVHPADGRLVLGPWPSFDPATMTEPYSSPAAGPAAGSAQSTVPGDASAEPSSAPSGSSPQPSSSAEASATPAIEGGVEVLESGPILDWDARWDETGTHLAVWIADPAERSFGHLSLYVVDPTTSRLEPDDHAIKSVPALPGFSIGKGRLAYATPAGQDGKGSSVRVQAWTNAGMGEGGTDGGQDQVIIIR